MNDEHEGTRRQRLIAREGVAFEAVSWSPSRADVDLSIACMFENEMRGAPLSGGLLELDKMLEGALTRMRVEGHFRAQEMETLLITTPQREICPRGVLIIGLGNPLTLDFAIMERALRVAVREANRFGAATVAFAPNLLDAGFTDLAPLHIEAAMVQGVVTALQAEHKLTEFGLAPSTVIRKWAFDLGAGRFNAATEEFLQAFKSLGAL